jgi:hypothetical protein
MISSLIDINMIQNGVQQGTNTKHPSSSISLLVTGKQWDNYYQIDFAKPEDLCAGDGLYVLDANKLGGNTNDNSCVAYQAGGSKAKSGKTQKSNKQSAPLSFSGRSFNCITDVEGVTKKLCPRMVQSICWRGLGEVSNSSPPPTVTDKTIPNGNPTSTGTVTPQNSNSNTAQNTVTPPKVVGSDVNKANPDNKWKEGWKEGWQGGTGSSSSSNSNSSNGNTPKKELPPPYDEWGFFGEASCFVVFLLVCSLYGIALIKLIKLRRGHYGQR